MPSLIELVPAEQPEFDIAADEEPSESLRASLLRQDPVAFDQLVQSEGPRVARLASRLMACSGDVEDIVQEVFVRAWQSLSRFRGDSTPGTWLGGITVNVCRTVQRRQRLWRLFLGTQSERQTEVNLQAHDRISDNEWLRLGLSRLKPSDREVLVLRWLEQKSVTEVAKLVGIRAKAAEVRLQRAKQRLTSILEELRG